MKITHLALILTIGLLGVTGWLAMDARSEAKKDRNMLALYQQRGQPDPAMQAKEDALLLAQMQEKSVRQPITVPTSAPLPTTSARMPAPMNPVPAPVTPETLAASPHISTEALNAAPPPLTPQQRVVLNAPALAKVKEVQSDYGFVIITAGTSKKVEVGMSFALRRASSIIGRIKVTEIDNNEAVGALQARSVPEGVAVEPGDDVIQDMPIE